ncbi:hypothetical protein SSX86_013877 [Deinandra increscens subsp. villosa]|uniref:Alpha-ketoglutarate-dependent dioxygenase AlkB-like domain-containing protein n=1 Tax=Deinandra increscens subsp. villosa TaxID=3103831 RepID=A0AAP0GZC1_9ASTR
MAELLALAKAKGCDLEPKPFSLIHPRYKKTPMSESETMSNLSTSYEILGPGMILFKNYISLKDQAKIVDICEKWGAGPGGFYLPSYPKGEEVVPYFRMMCFGRNWDPVTRYEKRFRSDGSEPPPIPSEFISLAEATIQDAQAHLDDLPSMRPDTCLVHFYEPAFAHSGLRQDLYESSDSLQRGLPVISISIGNPALFLYGNTNNEKKSDLAVLHSGDVLIYGGKSRPIFHMLGHIFGVSPGPLLLPSCTLLECPSKIDLVMLDVKSKKVCCYLCIHCFVVIKLFLSSGTPDAATKKPAAALEMTSSSIADTGKSPVVENPQH